MTLSALIRKRETVRVATAIPAISATQQAETEGTVARIATIAVANPPEGKTGQVPTSWGWLLHYTASDPVQVFCLPEPTHAEVLALYPDAIAAEPIPERTSIKATTVSDPPDADTLVGDYRELDRLIHQYADLAGMPQEGLAHMLEARKRMAPALIQRDIEQLHELIAETDPERRNHAND